MIDLNHTYLELFFILKRNYFKFTKAYELTLFWKESAEVSTGWAEGILLIECTRFFPETSRWKLLYFILEKKGKQKVHISQFLAFSSLSSREFFESRIYLFNRRNQVGSCMHCALIKLPHFACNSCVIYAKLFKTIWISGWTF